MEFIIIIVALIIIGIAGIVKGNSKSKNNNVKKEKTIKVEEEIIINVDEEYLNAVKSAKDILARLSDTSEYIDYNIAERIKGELEFEMAIARKYRPNKRYPMYNDYMTVVNVLNNYESNISQYNRKFVEKETKQCAGLLNDIDGKALDSQQKTAVVTDELHNLVVAGAGSGKTLTISGKVKYLCSRKNVRPEDILLITFTKKAADEMDDRINKRLGIPVKSMTFHKLGLDIYTKVSGERPDVFDDMEGFVTKQLVQQTKNDDDMMINLLSFFAYYISQIDEPKKYETYGDYISAMRTNDLEPLKSKYIRAKESGNLRSLAGERVKSVQEVIIANFFFLNGIEYEYEKEYPERLDKSRKKYRPDFYLPDYDIYWEHFSVDRNMKCHLNTREEECRKYERDMAWKRQTHFINSTKLVESYAYYGTDGNLLNKLRETCMQNGIKMERIDYREIYDTIFANKKERVFTNLAKLISSFIVLFKSNGYNKNTFRAFNVVADNMSYEFDRERTKLFLKIVESIYDKYEEQLSKSGMIDFSDMINKAADFVRDGKADLSYKYVIIDEYQDIGFDRYKLVEAILKQTGSKLMCVGDDWQSIFRFAGSNISLFTRFSEYWGPSEILRIEKTYRNSQQLIDIAGNFVMSNDEQMKKNLKSGKLCLDPLNAIYIKEEQYEDAVVQALDSIIESDGTGSSVLLLGRTRYDLEDLIGETKKEAVHLKARYDNVKGEKIIYDKAPDIDIRFLTVHKAKGAEADNVIMLNLRDDLLGFPNKITDDPLLLLVLAEESSFMYAEERRLFYVALTRTKNRVYMILNPHRESMFYYEIEKHVSGSRLKDSEAKTCPVCERGDMVSRINRFDSSRFYGCSNFPYCSYTENEKRGSYENRSRYSGGYSGKSNSDYGISSNSHSSNHLVYSSKTSSYSRGSSYTSSNSSYTSRSSSYSTSGNLLNSNNATGSSRVSLYIGHVKAKKYHRQGCEYGDKIAFSNRQTFNSKEEAENAGYVACRVCRP